MKQQTGFSLIEIMIAVLIVSLLAVAVTTSVSTQRARARDARRTSDISKIQLALESYIDQKRVPPNATNDSGGWDLSSIGTFMPFLTSEGFMTKVPVDPINDAANASSGYTYRYSYYPNGGVTVNGQNYTYYIIDAQKMETNAERALIQSVVVPK